MRAAGRIDPTRAEPACALVLGGVGLVVASVLELLLAFGPGIAVTDTVLIPYGSIGVRPVVDVVLLASTLLLAFGWRGRPGVLGRSILGRVGLVVFGAAGVLGRLLTSAVLVPSGWIAVVLGISLQVVPVAGLVIAAVQVVRVGVLRGASRWVLAPVAAVEVVTLGLQFVPALEVVPLLLVLLEMVVPLLLVAAGVGYLLRGRTELEARAGRLEPIRSPVSPSEGP